MKSECICFIFFGLTPLLIFGYQNSQWTSRIQQRLHQIKIEKETQLKDCCIASKIEKECLKLCSYNIHQNSYDVRFRPCLRKYSFFGIPDLGSQFLRKRPFTTFGVNKISIASLKMKSQIWNPET